MQVTPRDADCFQQLRHPPLRQRQPLYGAAVAYGAVHEDAIGVRRGAVAEDDALLGPGVQGSSCSAFRSFCRQVHKDQLTKGH